MALDPRIALGVKGIELQDPLAQYGKIQAIQGAQSQNQLAQMQMQAAQREQASTNALNAAYSAAYDPKTGEVDYNKLRTVVAQSGFGSKLPAIEKNINEAQKAKTDQQKAQVDLVDSKLKQSRQFLDTIDPADPSAPQKYLEWHQANHADPVLGAALKARGITPEQSMARIQQAIQQGPAAFAQLINESKLGTEKFMEMNKPHYVNQDTGGMLQTLSMPGLGGPATVVPGTSTKKVMSPSEAAHVGIARERLSQETATGNWSPDSLDLAAQIYVQTGQMPPVGSGKNALAIRDQIMQRAANVARGVPAPGAPAAPGAAASAPPPADMATAAGTIAANKQTVAAQAATVRDFSAGMSARKTTANSTAINHLDTIEKLADDLNNKDTRVFNMAGNLFAKGTGSPAPTSFDAARQLVAAEVIKAVAANGGSMQERIEAAEQFNRANSPAQLKGVVKTYKELLAGQLDTLQLQYETGTGRKDFDKKITPAAKKVLESMRPGAAPATAPATGPVRVNTPAEAAKLPPGTPFITPDGQQRVRQ